MTTASLSRSASTGGRLVRQGFAWWCSELAALAPRSLRQRLRLADDPCSLEITSEQATLILPGRGRSASLSLPIPAEGDEAARAHLRAALRQRGVDTAVAVRLAPALLLEASLDLPLSAERSLQAIVRHQLGRVVPLDPDDVCFAASVRQRSPGTKSLHVDLVIAKRAVVERSLQLARELGLVPLLVTGQAALRSPGQDEAAVLWRTDGTGQTAMQRRLRRGLEASILLLAVTAYGVHVHRLDQVVASLRDQVAVARQVAAATQDVARQVGQFGETATFMQDRRKAPSPLQVLDELTRLVPEDSWVTQLALQGNAVDLAGYAPRATDLIPKLEASKVFESPRFRSPITLASDAKGERFHLTFMLRPGPPP